MPKCPDARLTLHRNLHLTTEITPWKVFELGYLKLRKVLPAANQTPPKWTYSAAPSHFLNGGIALAKGRLMGGCGINLVARI